MLTKLTSIALAAVGMAAFAGPSLAQNYPDQTIRLIVPFAPGGGTEIGRAHV